MLDGRVTFRKLKSEFYIRASRVEHREAGPGLHYEVSLGVRRIYHVTGAVLAPGKQPLIHINDANVALGHAHPPTLLATAKQMGIKVVGVLVSCDWYPQAKDIQKAFFTDYRPNDQPPARARAR